MKKILFLFDNNKILEFLRKSFNKGDFIIYELKQMNLAEIMKIKPEILLLDVQLSGTDGIEICREIKNLKLFKDLIVVFISELKDDFVQIAALDAGADDFIIFPVKPGILIYRLNAIINRVNFIEKNNRSIINNNFKIDKEQLCVHTDDKTIYLSKKEFQLLCLLAFNSNKIFSRQNILTEVWCDKDVKPNNVDVLLNGIKKKLGNKYIENVRGIGYRFN